jgi:hypothetical protein
MQLLPVLCQPGTSQSLLVSPCPTHRCKQMTEEQNVWYGSYQCTRQSMRLVDCLQNCMHCSCRVLLSKCYNVCADYSRVGSSARYYLAQSVTLCQPGYALGLAGVFFVMQLCHTAAAWPLCTAAAV